MAKARLADVLSHWSKYFVDFETPVGEFYTSVQQRLTQHAVPDTHSKEITLRESGPFSSKRAYLRVQREHLTFDICAAPFGKGFFFSWWLSERPPGWGWLYLIVMFVAGYFTITRLVGRMSSLVAVGVGFLVYLVALFVLASVGVRAADTAMSALPVLGPLYRRLVRPVSYYRLDTIGMYQAAVKAAVEESIDEVTKAKGLRALTEEEKKPLMLAFYKR